MEQLSTHVLVYTVFWEILRPSVCHSLVRGFTFGAGDWMVTWPPHHHLGPPAVLPRHGLHVFLTEWGEPVCPGCSERKLVCVCRDAW